jgi:hypothetical protein
LCPSIGARQRDWWTTAELPLVQTNGTIKFAPFTAVLDVDLATLKRLSKKPRMLFFWLGPCLRRVPLPSSHRRPCSA